MGEELAEIDAIQARSDAGSADWADPISDVRFLLDAVRSLHRERNIWFAENSTAQAALGNVRELVQGPEVTKYRDEATRHVVAQPYADNRYVRLLDAVREAVR